MSALFYTNLYLNVYQLYKKKSRDEFLAPPDKIPHIYLRQLVTLVIVQKAKFKYNVSALQSTKKVTFNYVT